MRILSFEKPKKIRYPMGHLNSVILEAREYMNKTK